MVPSWEATTYAPQPQLIQLEKASNSNALIESQIKYIHTSTAHVLTDS